MPPLTDCLHFFFFLEAIVPHGVSKIQQCALSEVNSMETGPKTKSHVEVIKEDVFLGKPVGKWEVGTQQGRSQARVQVKFTEGQPAPSLGER